MGTWHTCATREDGAIWCWGSNAARQSDPTVTFHPLTTPRELNVAQCGYCQTGQIMQAASLLKDTPNPTDQQILDAMSGNICRCGTYPRIRAAIKRASGAA